MNRLYILFIFTIIFFKFDLIASQGHKGHQWCLQCHGAVPPSDYPQEKWPSIIEQMYRYAGSLETISGEKEVREDYLLFYKESPYKLEKSKIPDLKKLSNHYVSNSLKLKDYVEDYPKYDLSIPSLFKKKLLGQKTVPAVSHLQYVKWIEKEKISNLILMTDMGSGHIMSFNLDTQKYKTLGRLRHPSHLDVADINGDGLMDVVASDLGELVTNRTTKGQIVWFKNEGNGQFKKHVLSDKHGRCSDVRAGDIDGDGDIDLVAADFGYMKGKIFLLRNQGIKKGVPSFKFELIDSLSGAINAEFVDLNSDGKLDVVALFSQEHEKIIGYIQKGNSFERVKLADANNPGWGSSGMTLGDVDQDGDVDILWLNGDTMDNFIVKKNQGIHLLENQGKLKFKRTFLGFFPGIHKAQIGDLDSDGDLDIAGVGVLFPFGIKPKDNASVGWFERKKGGEYKFHTLEKNKSVHFGLVLKDIDGDKDIDLLVGNAAIDDLMGPPPIAGIKPSLRRLILFENGK